MKEHLAIFLSLVIGISAHHEVHLIPAHIICPDVTPDHDILLPDPNDCSVYYKCENGTAIPQSCPPGLEWCQILQNCTLPILANCSLSHTVVTYSPEELATYKPNPTTNETCPEDNVTLPDGRDCSKYKKCVNNVPTTQDCPEGELFDTWLGICTAPEISNCINVGSQENKTCPVNNATHIHPEDCSKYYDCVNNNVVTVQCPSGFGYNEWYGKCYPIELAHCHTYTIVTPTTSRTTIDTPISGKNVCPEGGYTLPNPLNCSTYYVCKDDTPTLEECPTDMYYSCWDQECLPPTDGQCSPSDGHTCKNSGDKLANSQDCGSYYECVDGTTEKRDCDNGLEYNEWFKKCVNSSVSHCTVEPTTTTTSTTSRTDIPTPCADNNICPKDNATLPNPFDCHSYFICRNETPVEEECPEGMDYSCWDQDCLPIDSANCVDQIQQDDNCGNMNNTMPNTEDCNSYYKCVNGKVALEECESELEFNAWFGKCVDSSESHCPLHTTTTPNSTPTTHVPESTTGTTTSRNPLCTKPDLMYPSFLYCNAYMKCDKNGQLKTIICNPPQFHYNCETKQCENITHCCSATNNTITPSPSSPSETSTPSSPQETSTPSSPPGGNTPSIPPETSTPSGPSETSTPSSPPGGSTPSTPPGGSTPSSPSDSSTPNGSPETSTPSSPPGGSTPSSPPGGNTPSNPPETSTPSSPPETSTPSIPPGGSTPSSPPETSTPSSPQETSTPSSPSETSTPSSPPETSTPSSPPETSTPSIPPGGSTPSSPPETSTPSSPQETSTPSSPSETSTPSSPPESSTPSGPPETSTPSSPPGGSTPSSPPEISTPSSLPVVSTPSIPPETSTPSGPPETSTPSGPPETSTPSSPPGGSTPSTPPGGSTPSSPSDTSTPNGSPETSTRSSPPGGSTPSSPPGGNTPSSPPETSTPTSPPETSTPSIPPGGSTPSSPPETSTPSSPQETSTPSSPSETSTPSSPPKSSTPSGPPETSTPSSPPGGSTPSSPPGGSTPSSPPETSTPSSLPVVSTPSIPPETSTPSGPPETSTPSGPPETSTPSSPPGGSTPSTPPGGSTPSSPSDTSTPNGSPETSTPSSPPGGNTPSSAPETSTPTSPPETSTPSIPPGGSTPSSPPETSTPSSPQETSTPSSPSETSTPSSPPESSTPSGPPETSTPSSPPGGSTPSSPPETSTPSNLPVVSTPSIPPETSTPSSPPETSTPSSPPETSTPSSSPVASTPSSPPESSTPSGPPGASTPSSLPETSTPSSPTSASTPSSPPETSTPSGPPETSTPSNPPDGSTPSSPPGGSTPSSAPGGSTPSSQPESSTLSVPQGGSTPSGPPETSTSSTPPGGNTPSSPSGSNPLCPPGSKGTKFPAFTDCHGYQICNEKGQLEQEKCIPPEFNYNCESKQCENITHCCAPHPTSSTSTTTTIQPAPSPSPYDDVCPYEGAKLPNPVDCMSYFVCRNNTPVSESCPSGQEYSCWDQTCKTSNDATCIKNVLPGQSCSDNVDQLPNIGDCGSYYKCENGKTVLTDCDSGLFYNKWYNECLDTPLSHCQTYPTPPPGVTHVPLPPTKPPSETENICPFEGARMPNPMDCTSYFVCKNNKPTPQNCPAGQGYSCWDQICESSAVAKCITDSHPGDSCSIENLILPKIEDCNSFFNCRNGSVISEKCPSEKEYNSWYGECLNAEYSHCHASTTSSSTPTTTISTSTITASPTKDVCPIEGAKLPNPIDCHLYFVCVNETPEVQECPNGQIYSCWDQECENPENAVCIKDGSQEEEPCSKDDVQQQNVEDCSTYYECVNGKIELKHCSKGKSYNKWFKKCLRYDLAHCTTYPTIKPSSTKAPPQTTIPPNSEIDVCPFEGALLPNTLDCSTFFRCQNNRPTLQKCPSGMGYSCWNQRCESNALDQCNPNNGIGHPCSVEKLILPNIEDCESYLECQNGTTIEQSCSPGKEFNEWFEKCVERPYSHCKSVPTPSESTSTTTPTLPPIPCPLNGATLPDPLNCSLYFTCKNGEIVSEQCPAGELYSCWDQQCEGPKDATCINQGNQEGQHCSNDGELLPNIAKCSSYYKCIDGKVEIKSCAEGHMYDKWLKICVEFDAKLCVTYPTVTERPTTSFPDPTSPIADYDVCPFENALLPNPLDCTTYYECINGTLVLQDCPNGYKYSCWNQECELDSGATCVTDGAQNGESCKINELRITDVTNCNNFYECDNGTIIRKQCPSGEEFNSAFQGCYKPELSHCHTYTTSEPGPPTPPATPATPTTSDTCPYEGATLPNPLNCSAFYICKNGTPTSELCADGYGYSCWNQECEPAEQAHCISEGNQNGTSCKNKGQKLQNIEDCHSYYECEKGKVELKHCHFNWYFNKWFEICVPLSILAHCKQGSTVPPPTPPKPTPPPKINDDICPFDGALLPDALDCTKYYKCENNTPVSQTCPSGQIYSCWDQQCKEASEAQCITNATKPGQHCSRDGVRIQNLESCTSYYECMNGITETNYCSIGFQYNKWYQKCVLKPYAHCNISHVTPTPATIPTTITTPTPSIIYDICPIEGALFPNPVDCTSFYQCINGTPTIEKCGDGMEYSCWDQKCELDSDADCIIVGSQLGKNCSIDGLRLPNIENCSTYFECNNTKTELKQCPPGLEFNDRFQCCYPPDRAHCNTYPTITPSIGTEPANPTTPSPQPGNNICPTEGTLIPNPVNCSQYYKCINGTPTPQLCALGYEYSCWDQICEPAGEAQCIAEAPPPAPSCSKNGQQNPDPVDCKKYTVCIKHVPITKTCPDDLYYSPWYRKCVKKNLAHCNETTTITPEPTSTTLAPGPHDYCPNEDAINPNPADCSSYYKCVKNKPTLKKCPKGQEYSCWDQECKKASEAQCIIVGSQVGKNCSKDGVTLQNPESCTSYLECMGGIVQEHFCFILFKYNKWYEYCTLDLFSHCKTFPTIAPPTTTTVKPVVTTIRYPQASCIGDKKRAPDVKNCNNYYICDTVTPVMYNCPPGYNYDVWAQDCKPVSQALCVKPPHVGEKCSKEGQTVPDPENCKKYYTCKNKKITSVTCPLFLSYCVWEERCTLSIVAKCVKKIV